MIELEVGSHACNAAALALAKLLSHKSKFRIVSRTSMSKRAYFGTDGIRGQANTHAMTAEVALRVGLAAGKLVHSATDRRPLVVTGKATRLSGYMIEPALVARFASLGMDVRLFGPLPTPAVAMMTRSMRADLGVMISASHNSFADNGIKLFGP